MSAEAKQRFEQEEQAYWQQRDELLQRYAGKWVAVVAGQVAAVGDQMNKVAAEALQKTGSGLMYVNLVGGEDIVLRVRSASSGYYDQGYTPPMPSIEAPVTDVRQSASVDVSFVVDTGADLTLLRSDIADEVDLWNDTAGRLHVAGIGGSPAIRQLYNALVQIAGETILVTADCRDDIDEDILEPDAINEFSLTVCAKRAQVLFERIDDLQP
jgi:predicted aspartyl protease